MHHNACSRCQGSSATGLGSGILAQSRSRRKWTTPGYGRYMVPHIVITAAFSERDGRASARRIGSGQATYAPSVSSKPHSGISLSHAVRTNRKIFLICRELYTMDWILKHMFLMFYEAPTLTYTKKQKESPCSSSREHTTKNAS